MELANSGAADARSGAFVKVADIARVIALQFLELRFALGDAGAALRQALCLAPLLIVGDALDQLQSLGRAHA